MWKITIKPITYGKNVNGILDKPFFITNESEIQVGDLIEEPQIEGLFRVEAVEPITSFAKIKNDYGFAKVLSLKRVSKLCSTWNLTPEKDPSKGEKQPVPTSRFIEISLEQARDWYQSSNAELKKLALQAYSLPELCFCPSDFIDDFEYSLEYELRSDVSYETSVYKYLKLLALYFNKDWKKTASNKGYCIARAPLHQDIVHGSDVLLREEKGFKYLYTLVS